MSDEDLSKNLSPNEANVENFRNRLFKYLYKYITENRNRNRKLISTTVNPEVYREFQQACQHFGLYPRQGINIIIEALMKLTAENFKRPISHQTYLFYKPTFNVKKMELNIAQKLELKLVKQQLTLILERLEKSQGEPKFHLSRLKETLPKAIRLYQKTHNQEIAKLLEKAEKWIELKT